MADIGAPACTVFETAAELSKASDEDDLVVGDDFCLWMSEDKIDSEDPDLGGDEPPPVSLLILVVIAATVGLAFCLIAVLSVGFTAFDDLEPLLKRFITLLEMLLLLFDMYANAK